MGGKTGFNGLVFSLATSLTRGLLQDKPCFILAGIQQGLSKQVDDKK